MIKVENNVFDSLGYLENIEQMVRKIFFEVEL